MFYTCITKLYCRHQRNPSLCSLINETMTVASLLCHSESQVQSVFPLCHAGSKPGHSFDLFGFASRVSKKKCHSLSEGKVQRQLCTDVSISSLLLFRGPGKLEVKPQKETLPSGTGAERLGDRCIRCVDGCMPTQWVCVKARDQPWELFLGSSLPSC